MYCDLKNVVNIELYNLVQDCESEIIICGDVNTVKLASQMLKEHKKQIVYSVMYTDEDAEEKLESLKKDELSKLDSISKVSKNYLCIIISDYYAYFYTKLNEFGFDNIFRFSKDEVSAAYNYFEVMKWKKEIDELISYLNDDYSKKVIKNILLARITNNFSYIDKIQDKDLHNEYFDPSIIQLTENETFVDMGAFVGDTLGKFIANVNFKFNKAYLFEPDYNNYSMLKKLVDRNILLTENTGKIKETSIDKVAGKIKIYNKGVYSKNGVLKFKSNQRMGSRVHDEGKSKIDVIQLDDFIDREKEKITFMKMDIEGSELEAIKGCENIIKEQKPKLAICIYHKVGHLVEIPLLLKTLVPEYKLYIRHYNSNLWDTVCYAIPQCEVNN